ncbi:MAG: 2-amino-4-hydroxy-6-hydroxymethyldihydropteridine diphosphokinase [Chloroflexi bacterium]|nr:2-amino-4-hydroxy-6-hydroxymethyldihydropteridine diphosphokinase [Chloroflexota bacterium]
MSDLYRIFLNIGSNIQPERNLPQAIDLLRRYGQVQAVSSAWESHAIGMNGPNFLNACVLLETSILPDKFKEQVIVPVETDLRRVRNENKNAPRTIDIDIVMTDGTPANLHLWDHAFVIVPMAELIPEFVHPVTREKLSRTAKSIRSQVWIIERPEILKYSS